MKYLPLAILPAIAIARAEPAPTLGIIGDIKISGEEVRETLAGLESSQRGTLSNDPATIGQYTRALLIQRWLLQEAKDKQWDQKPEVIAKLVRARESALTESYLDSVSAAPASYPSETELRETYDRAKPSLQATKSYRISQIFIPLPESADKASQDKAKAKLNILAKQWKETDTDASAIAQHDHDTSTGKAQGGEIGWISENQIQPEIRDFFPALKTGTVSTPVKLGDGWHILKVLDAREAHTPPLDQVRDQLAFRLRTERARLNRQEYLKRLLEKHPIEINETELTRIAQSGKP